MQRSPVRPQIKGILDGIGAPRVDLSQVNAILPSIARADVPRHTAETQARSDVECNPCEVTGANAYPKQSGQAIAFQARFAGRILSFHERNDMPRVRRMCVPGMRRTRKMRVTKLVYAAIGLLLLAVGGGVALWLAEIGPFNSQVEALRQVIRNEPRGGALELGRQRDAAGKAGRVADFERDRAHVLTEMKRLNDAGMFQLASELGNRYFDVDDADLQLQIRIAAGGNTRAQ